MTPPPKWKIKWVILLQLFWIPAPFRDLGHCRQFIGTFLSYHPLVRVQLITSNYPYSFSNSHPIIDKFPWALLANWVRFRELCTLNGHTNWIITVGDSCRSSRVTGGNSPGRTRSIEAVQGQVWHLHQHDFPLLALGIQGGLHRLAHNG